MNEAVSLSWEFSAYRQLSFGRKKGNCIMGIEEKLEGARNGFAFYLSYLNTVGQEIGVEKAMALSAQTDTMMGEAQGRLMREQAGGEDVDISTAADMATDLIKESFGISSVIVKQSPDKVVLRCTRCPVYEAGHMTGHDTGMIEQFCRTGAIGFMDAMVKQLNPSLNYQLTKFRSGAEDCCEEEISMS
jgi:hypothetical protein